MGKLLKYELRKMRTTRLFILVLAAVGVLISMGAWLLGYEDVAVLTVAGMMVAAFFTLFYVGIEGIVLLNKDLKTKQSYMLWMVPKSAWEVIGAKALASILQMMFGFAFIILTASGIFVTAVLTYEGYQKMWEIMKEMFYIAFDVRVDWLSIFAACTLIFVGWVSVIMTGFLAVILSRTLLIQSKWSSFLAVVIFLAIDGVASKIFEALPFSSMGTTTDLALSILYYVLVSAGLYLFTGFFAQKKLSV